VKGLYVRAKQNRYIRTRKAQCKEKLMSMTFNPSTCLTWEALPGVKKKLYPA